MKHKERRKEGRRGVCVCVCVCVCEKERERKRERWWRGNIHQINTSVALIVISPPWLLLCHARQAAKRDLSMQS